MKRLILILVILLSTQTAYAAISRSFDGTNDELDWGDVANTTTGNRTVCGWFKMTEDASADAMVGRKNDLGAATLGYAISQDSSDVVTFNVGDGTESVTSTATTDIDGAWYMVCGNWQANTEVTTIWVNGIQEDTDTGGGAVDSIGNAVEFAVGETGAEGDDATMAAGWITTAANSWTAIEINEIRWHPEGRAASAGPGTTLLIVPAWLGASPELDIANSLDATVSNSAANTTDGPPIMIGALGANY